MSTDLSLMENPDRDPSGSRPSKRWTATEIHSTPREKWKNGVDFYQGPVFPLNHSFQSCKIQSTIFKRTENRKFHFDNLNKSRWEVQDRLSPEPDWKSQHYPVQPSTRPSETPDPRLQLGYPSTSFSGRGKGN